MITITATSTDDLTLEQSHLGAIEVSFEVDGITCVDADGFDFLSEGAKDAVHNSAVDIAMAICGVEPEPLLRTEDIPPVDYDQIKSKILAEFNFEGVHKAMAAMDMKWHTTGVPPHVPSMAELHDHAEKLLSDTIAQVRANPAGWDRGRVMSGGFWVFVAHEASLELLFVADFVIGTDYLGKAAREVFASQNGSPS